jgi:hypothetical protein
MTGDSQREDERAPRVWPEPPTPFLSQPRALSALRRELDVIVGEIQPSIERCRVARPEGSFEVVVLPHRVIARVEVVAVSFSWLSGRLPTVADGCLLVIAWSNVASGVRGAAALKSATPTHERTYIAEGASPDQWRWCADDLVEQSCSSKHLTAEWMARTTIAWA